MNSAIRVQKLLEKMIVENKQYDNKTSKGTSFEVFENTFNVKGCINIAQKLKIVKHEINKLKEYGHVTTINYLNNIFDDKDMNRSLYSLLRDGERHIVALHPMGKLLGEENIDKKLITELSEIILLMKTKIDTSEIDDEYKKILYSYVQELEQGILDIDFGGIEGLLFHLEIANGKVATYTEVFRKDSDIFNDIKNIYKKTTEILDSVQIWTGFIGYGMGLLTK